MTVGFNQLVVGDEVEMKGPLGSFVWQGQGTALYRGVPKTYKEIGMVCAGSGKYAMFLTDYNIPTISRRHHSHSSGLAGNIT